MSAACARCRKPNARITCDKCQTVSYCSSNCQTSDWKRGHRKTCASYSSSAKFRSIFWVGLGVVIVASLLSWLNVPGFLFYTLSALRNSNVEPANEIEYPVHAVPQELDEDSLPGKRIKEVITSVSTAVEKGTNPQAEDFYELMLWCGQLKFSALIDKLGGIPLLTKVATLELDSKERAGMAFFSLMAMGDLGFNWQTANSILQHGGADVALSYADNPTLEYRLVAWRALGGVGNTTAGATKIIDSKKLPYLYELLTPRAIELRTISVTEKTEMAIKKLEMRQIEMSLSIISQWSNSFPLMAHLAHDDVAGRLRAFVDDPMEQIASTAGEMVRMLTALQVEMKKRNMNPELIRMETDIEHLKPAQPVEELE